MKIITISMKAIFLFGAVCRNEARDFALTAPVSSLLIPCNLDCYVQATNRGRISEAMHLDPFDFDNTMTNEIVLSTETTTAQTFSFEYYDDQYLSLFQLIARSIAPIYRKDPTSFAVLAMCISVFVMWQVPACHGFLERYFILSRHRIFPNMLTSAVSHANLVHLSCNMVAFVHFAPVVKRALSQTSWELWPFLVGAAFIASTTFLAFSTQPGLGLSGVTMALLAFYCKMYPQANVGIYVGGVVPLRIPAYQLLSSSLVSSVLGTIFDTPYQRSRVAHASHLGGLLFGMGYFELWKQRLLARAKGARMKDWNPYSFF